MPVVNCDLAAGEPLELQLKIRGRTPELELDCEVITIKLQLEIRGGTLDRHHQHQAAAATSEGGASGSGVQQLDVEPSQASDAGLNAGLIAGPGEDMSSPAKLRRLSAATPEGKIRNRSPCPAEHFGRQRATPEFVTPPRQDAGLNAGLNTGHADGDQQSLPIFEPESCPASFGGRGHGGPPGVRVLVEPPSPAPSSTPTVLVHLGA